MPSGSVDDAARTLAVGTRGTLVDHGLSGERSPCLARLRVSSRLVTGPERVSFVETLVECECDLRESSSVATQRGCIAHSGERLEMGSRSFVGAPEGGGNGRRTPLVHSMDLAG